MSAVDIPRVPAVANPSLSANTAAISSRRGILVDNNGATLVFEHTNDTKRDCFYKHIECMRQHHRLGLTHQRTLVMSLIPTVQVQADEGIWIYEFY